VNDAAPTQGHDLISERQGQVDLMQTANHRHTARLGGAAQLEPRIPDALGANLARGLAVPRRLSPAPASGGGGMA
jgi:hypothetical protein